MRYFCRYNITAGEFAYVFVHALGLRLPARKYAHSCAVTSPYFHDLEAYRLVDP